MNEEIILIYTHKAKFSNSERLDFAAYKRRKPKNKKGITNTELRLISRKLTGELKNQIRRQRHIDTGKMLRVTKVTATIGARGELVAKVFSTDYWKYVDGNFNILKNAMKTRKWKSYEKMFNEMNKDHPKRR